ncbi:ATP-binding cassette domain-containing protein, partial [bacterium]
MTDIRIDIRPGRAPDSGSSAVAAPVREHVIRPAEPAAISIENLSLWYGHKRALTEVSLDIPVNRVTALIGPSGCGKSTLLRSINRMNDLVPGVRTRGTVAYHGIDIYGKDIDPVEVRRRIGMVFQKPNPFPKSIYDNVAFGARVNGYRGNLDDLVESSLRRAALWDEVKDD